MAFFGEKIRTLFNSRAQGENLARFCRALDAKRVCPSFRTDGSFPVAEYDAATKTFTFIYLRAPATSPVMRALNNGDTLTAKKILEAPDATKSVFVYTEKMRQKKAARRLQSAMDAGNRLLGMIDFYLSPMEDIESRNQHLGHSRVLQQKMDLNWQMTPEKVWEAFSAYQHAAISANTLETLSGVRVRDAARDHAHKLLIKEWWEYKEQEEDSLYHRASLDIAISVSQNAAPEQMDGSSQQITQGDIWAAPTRQAATLALQLVFSPTLKN